MEPITLLALGILGSKYFKGAKTASKLEISPNDVKFDKKTGKLFVDIDFLNPTNNDLKVDSVIASVFVNDRKVGTIERTEPFTIKKKDHTFVRLQVKASLLGFASLIMSSIRDGVKEVKFKVLGTARALGIENAINEEVSLNL